MLPLPDSPSPSHCQSPTPWEILDPPLPTFLLGAGSLSSLMSTPFSLGLAMSYSSSGSRRCRSGWWHPAGVFGGLGRSCSLQESRGRADKKPGRTLKSWICTWLGAEWRCSWKGIHLLSEGVAASLTLPPSVKKERTTAGPAQVSSWLHSCQPSTTPGNKKLSAVPTLLSCFLFSSI